MLYNKLTNIMFKVSPYYTLYGSTLERPNEFDDRGLKTLGREYLDPEKKGMFLEHTERMEPVLHQIRNLKENSSYDPSRILSEQDILQSSSDSFGRFSKYGNDAPETLRGKFEDAATNWYHQDFNLVVQEFTSERVSESEPPYLPLREEIINRLNTAYKVDPSDYNTLHNSIQKLYNHVESTGLASSYDSVAYQVYRLQHDSRGPLLKPLLESCETSRYSFFKSEDYLDTLVRMGELFTNLSLEKFDLLYKLALLNEKGMLLLLTPLFLCKTGLLTSVKALASLHLKGNFVLFILKLKKFAHKTVAKMKLNTSKNISKYSLYTVKKSNYKVLGVSTTAAAATTEDVLTYTSAMLASLE